MATVAEHDSQTLLPSTEQANAVDVLENEKLQRIQSECAETEATATPPEADLDENKNDSLEANDSDTVEEVTSAGISKSIPVAEPVAETDVPSSPDSATNEIEATKDIESAVPQGVKETEKSEAEPQLPEGNKRPLDTEAEATLKRLKSSDGEVHVLPEATTAEAPKEE